MAFWVFTPLSLWVFFGESYFCHSNNKKQKKRNKEACLVYFTLRDLKKPTERKNGEDFTKPLRILGSLEKPKVFFLFGQPPARHHSCDPEPGFFAGPGSESPPLRFLPTTMYLYHYPTARLYYTASLLYLFCCCAAYVAGPYGPLPPALGAHLAVVRL